jgi:hypothetical protein
MSSFWPFTISRSRRGGRVRRSATAGLGPNRPAGKRTNGLHASSASMFFPLLPRLCLEAGRSPQHCPDPSRSGRDSFCTTFCARPWISGQYSLLKPAAETLCQLVKPCEGFSTTVCPVEHDGLHDQLSLLWVVHYEICEVLSELLSLHSVI